METQTAAQTETNKTHYKTIKIEGLDIFYREAGSPDKPTILLLHGYPTSSHMFRNLIKDLGHKYHLIAPDYPGFGNSSMPFANDFEYSFDHLAKIIELFIAAKGLEKYSLYMMDYGAPVGFRIASGNPEKVQALLIQNGNAYLEGLSPFWEPIKNYWAEPENNDYKAIMISSLSLEGTKMQYLTGVRNPGSISPDPIMLDQLGLDRPGNKEIQLALYYSYRTNISLYPEWQEYLRKHQPPALITWGRNDEIFPASGAYAYLKDLPDAELHLLDTGHFALEEDGPLIAALIDQFLMNNRII
jgi:pimeloyl-ACP methyl ester carboxylesterase